jgi:hypothetical protein
MENIIIRVKEELCSVSRQVPSKLLVASALAIVAIVVFNALATPIPSYTQSNNDTHLVKLELLSNATTIDSALNYIRSKQQQKQLTLGSITNKDDQPVIGGRQTVF